MAWVLTLNRASTAAGAPGQLTRLDANPRQLAEAVLWKSGGRAAYLCSFQSMKKARAVAKCGNVRA
jgi:hypothetical protein